MDGNVSTIVHLTLYIHNDTKKNKTPLKML